ncbi:MAG TPA: Rieske (2Fe-2S) protein [Polyangia bacterium]|nr:Rieske (2Fe-2S) protein [Polyangia bacterium]
MTRHLVGRASELPPGSRKIVEFGGRSIGVFNIGGSFYALRNRCPHQGAPLCLGSIGGTAATSAPGEYSWGREGEILRCPWHGWEFDITTGESVFNPHQMKVRSYDVTVSQELPDDVEKIAMYPVEVEDGLVLLEL